MPASDTSIRTAPKMPAAASPINGGMHQKMGELGMGHARHSRVSAAETTGAARHLSTLPPAAKPTWIRWRMGEFHPRRVGETGGASAS